MDGTDSPESAADKDEDEDEVPQPPSISDSFSGVCLTDAPILLLVYLHKLASESGPYDHELILELHRRFEFLKLAYKCHCETEDEDIFSVGSETSSTIVEWAMSEMLKNPRLMKEAQAEVRRVFDGKGKVDEFGIHELKFLKAVIKETLRCFENGTATKRGRLLTESDLRRTGPQRTGEARRPCFRCWCLGVGLEWFGWLDIKVWVVVLGFLGLVSMLGVRGFGFVGGGVGGGLI
ncbi:hypothetical protein Q3G72_005016 [Acer saccharum]|nr:hypothetical protein Q3G72_005016 [Acer saccharum]